VLVIGLARYDGWKGDAERAESARAALVGRDRIGDALIPN